MSKIIENYGDRLSHLMDLEELIIMCVNEDHGIGIAKAGELFRASETYKKLFEPNSTYYTAGHETIFNDFTMELLKAGELT